VNPLLILAFAATAFVLALLLFPVLINLLHRWALHDHPSDRKIHTAFTPSMGGICILLAAGLTLLLAVPLTAWAQWKLYFIALAIIFVTGLRDDILVLSPGQKLLGQLLPVAILVFAGGIQITSLYSLWSGPLPFWAASALTVLALVAVTNSFNLIDGIDGLAGVLSLLAFLALGTWFWLAGQHFPALLAGVFCGAIGGFLYYNWQPSKIFMGDTGTLPIGFTIAVLLILFMEANFRLPAASSFRFSATIGTALCVFFVPAFDTARVVMYRLVNRQSPFRADRNHLHHHLLRLGLSHAQTALLLAAVNACFIGLAWVGKSWPEHLLLPVVAVAALMLNFGLHVALRKNAGKD
jgi:UDP-N-acetylmuramyl pentapeptide phosphotransferase/UDP-N-acetylglucosamine-1-phosphate transferase